MSELILSDGSGTGCTNEKIGASCKEFVVIIFVSGEFGADFTHNSVRVMYCSELLHLPTSNGVSIVSCVHQDG